jgi:tRNA (guanine6-N2)-methyltransferase
MHDRGPEMRAPVTDGRDRVDEWSNTRLWARAGRGFEWIAAAEIGLRRGWRVDEVGHRSVFFAADRADDALGLRTVDDVYVHCGRIAGLDHTRASLQRLEAGVAELDLERQPGEGRVTASFLGRRNYNRFEIEEVVQLGAGHWRVHLWDEFADVGLRIADEPLHRRAWKVADRPGTLHPPAAAAVALLGAPAPGDRVLDPFCGAGTIMIEALLLEPGLRAQGADIDPAAVALARENLRRAGVTAEVREADATIAEVGTNRLLTNLPWGAASPARGSLAAFVDRIPIILDPAGRVAVLAAPETELAAALDRAGFAVRHQSRVRLSGRVADLVAAGAADEALESYERRFTRPL